MLHCYHCNIGVMVLRWSFKSTNQVRKLYDENLKPLGQWNCQSVSLILLVTFLPSAQISLYQLSIAVTPFRVADLIFWIQFFQSAFKVWRGELALQMQISRSIFESPIESGLKLWRGYIINCDLKKYITKRYARKWSLNCLPTEFYVLEYLLRSGWRYIMVLFQLIEFVVW